MAEILFKRTFHSVGQGAFFTEQFFPKGDPKEPIFNVVFDCGSLSKKYNQIISNSIKKVLDNNSHIDLLFISHFDADHINGIQYMLDNMPNLIDNETIVILPFKYAKTLSALRGLGAYDNIGILIQKMQDRDVHIVGIDDDIDLFDGQPRFERNTIPIDSLKYRNTIPNYCVLIKDIHWHYVPFMLKRNRSNYLDKFKAELNKIESNLEDLFNNDYIRNNFDKIAYAARQAGTGNAINMHSLQLLSFIPNQTLNTDVKGLCVTGQYDHNTGKWTESSNSVSLPPSCLYTGDTNLKSVHYYSYEMFFVRETLVYYSHNWKLGMMQIPHHGSHNNYPVKLATDSMVLSAFVNYDSAYRQSVFDDNICDYFDIASKLLFKVMESHTSELVATVLYLYIE